MRDLSALIGIVLIMLGLAIAGCQSSRGRSSYPYTQPVDPVTEEALDVRY